MSSNFQSQYSGFENSDWQGQNHQQNQDRETSSHHICFQENPIVNESFETDEETSSHHICFEENPTVKESFETDEESEIQICESSNHLNENRLSGSSEI